MTWQKTRINIDDDLGPAERQEVAEDIIEFIRDRTQRGIGLDGKFPGYTKQYAKKKGQTNVDLTLSSEMLESIELLSHKKGSLLIGFKNNTTANAKAEGNQTGSYGRSPNSSKARPFLGLSLEDLDRIMESFEN